MKNSKWKMVIQILISILTALAQRWEGLAVWRNRSLSPTPPQKGRGFLLGYD